MLMGTAYTVFSSPKATEYTPECAPFNTGLLSLC